MEGYVILVDDDPDELFFAERAFVELHVRYYSFTSSFEGLALLSSGLQEAPSHIFLDLNMPGLNGQDVLKRLRKIEAFKDTTVVVWSTVMTENLEQSLLKSGATLAIAKPSSALGYKKILLDVFEHIPAPIPAG